MQYTGLCLPGFQNTQVNPEEFVKRWYQTRHIPVRLLQSAKNINTSRITAFLEFILKPISENVCRNCPEECFQNSRP